MGFDINVSLDLQMCADTGRPYVWGPKFEKIYDINLANYTIPEELRRYAVGRGSIFYVYTKHFNEQDTYNVTTDMFLDEYPSWNFEASRDDRQMLLEKGKEAARVWLKNDTLRSRAILRRHSH